MTHPVLLSMVASLFIFLHMEQWIGAVVDPFRNGVMINLTKVLKRDECLCENQVEILIVGKCFQGRCSGYLPQASQLLEFK